MDEKEAGVINSLKKTSVFAIISLLAAVLALSSATFAWFTSNTSVSTNKVTAGVADVNAKLELSAAGGTSFKGVESVSINKVNENDNDPENEKLLPVSTSDLENFVYPNSVNKDAKYLLDEDENRYFHGTFYLRGSCGGSAAYTKMVLYLDEIDKMIASDVDSQFANAGRIGIKMKGNSPVIIRMSEEENESTARVNNTYLDGILVEEGYVIHKDGSSGSAEAVEDPSKSLKTYSAAEKTPTPVAVINLDEIYEVDIYFYLEGCDPDCSDSVSKDEVEVYISLFGVPEA